VRPVAMEFERAPKLSAFPPARPVMLYVCPAAVAPLLEKKCWPFANPARLLVKFPARLPRLPWVCATGRAPCIMLPPRSMLSLTGMERPMRPPANSCAETFLTAPRTRALVIMFSRFEP